MTLIKPEWSFKILLSLLMKGFCQIMFVFSVGESEVLLAHVYLVEKNLYLLSDFSLLSTYTQLAVRCTALKALGNFQISSNCRVG